MLAVCLLAVAAAIHGVGGAELRRQPPITYQSAPNLRTEDQALDNVRQATNVAGWSASEAAAAASQADSAEAAEASSQAELEATRHALEAQKVVHRSKRAVEDAITVTHISEAAATHSRDLVEEIPAVAMKAAHDAVDEVVAEAYKRMEAEARKTADEAARQLRAAQLAAAHRAQEDAQPFVDGQIRSEKNSIEFLKQARVAGVAATDLMNEAMRVSSLAEAYQAANNPVVAQTVLNKAHDLMHKAKQLEGVAHGDEATAHSVGGLGGPYGKAAKAAIQYGTWQGNPGGKPPPLPPLPAPLELPPAAK